jgi:WD40 repeat protein/DNA-binding SARP family transcriptional activator
MDFRILGPLEVRDELGAVALGGVKPRAVLAVLLLHADEPVSAEKLAVALWGEDAPAGASKTVQVYVSRLRKSLGDPEIVATTSAGYRLRLGDDELDSERFGRLVDEGRAALGDGRPNDAARILRGALDMWRGPPLADLAFEPFAAPEINRLEEQRQAALEAHAEAELAAGHHAAMVGELERLVALHPTREKLAGQLMIALYRCGRQAEALEVYREVRRRLVAEVGIEPGPELRRLHDAILQQDDSLELPVPAAELPGELDATAEPPLVGRDADLGWLRRRWDRARRGNATLVALAGVPGIGKTRLAAELAAEANGAGAAVLHADGLSAEAALAAVRKARAAKTPALLVVEDADRAGAEVRAALVKLPGGADGRCLLALLTGADGQRLAALGDVDVLELEPLDDAAVAAVAAGYAPGQPPAEPPVEWLLEASDGVPRRVHEAAREWAQREASRRVGAIAGRAAAGRAELRSMEAELVGGVVDLQAARDRASVSTGDDATVICPFKGLAAFDVDDAEYFSGRDRLVAELVARLVGAPLLGIVGPSGSGKSSVLRAGLLPALAGGVLPGSDEWEQVLIRPTEHPLDELNRAGADVGDDSRVVLAVDQFEETFTACSDERERAAFIASLVHAARDTHGRCLVVLAIRADHYERCAAYADLSGLLAANHVLVTSMRRDELRQSIDNPARRAGLRVERGLADALIADVEGEPGALPLLSTALLELWQRRDGPHLRHASYEHTGGVRGAVARLAEEAYGQLDSGQQAVARSVLTRLATEGAGGAVERRRVPLAELETQRSDDTARVIELFTERRLLTVSAGSVEVAHEALLREWPRLREWIEEGRAGMRIHRAVTAAAEEWQRLGRDDGALYRGGRLTEALEWREAQRPVLNALESDFLDTAATRLHGERAARRRRIRLAFASLTAGLAAITAIALVAIYQGHEAGKQRDIAVSQRLAATATNALDVDPSESLGLALRAMDSASTAEAAVALRQATLQDRTVAVLRGHRGRVASASFSPDGHRAVSGGADGTVRIWDLDRHRLLHTITGPPGIVRAAYSPDGARIASVGTEGSLAVMDANGRGRRVLMRSKGGALFALDFSPDGGRIAAGAMDGSVYVVDADAGGSPRVLRGHRAPITTVGFNGDGRRLVSGDYAGTLRVWNLASGDSREIVVNRDGISHADFTGDDRSIVSSGLDGRIEVLDAGTGSATRVLKDPGGVLFAAAASADGRQVVSGGPNGTVRLWDVATGAELAALRGHEGDVTDVGFSPRGDRIISSGEDATVRVWRPPAQRIFPALPGIYGAAFSADAARILEWGDGGIRIIDSSDGTVDARMGRGTVSAAALSPDGKSVIGGEAGNAVRVWSAAGGPPTIRLGSHKQQVNAVAFSSDGRRAVSAGDDGQVIVWDLAASRASVVDRPGGRLNAAGFSPDGARFLSAGEDGVVRIWRADRAAKPIAELAGDGQEINAAAFSPDGRRVATAAADGTIRLRDVAGGGSRILTGHVGQVTAVAFSRDGTRLASAGGDGTVRIWDAASGQPIVVLAEHHGGDAVSAGFSPDGREVLSAGVDGRIRVSSCDVCGSLAEVVALARSRRAP